MLAVTVVFRTQGMHWTFASPMPDYFVASQMQEFWADDEENIARAMHASNKWLDVNAFDATIERLRSFDATLPGHYTIDIRDARCTVDVFHNPLE